MRESTTIRVSPSTRDALRELADDDGVTLDQALLRVLRAERQRRLGVSLAAEPTERDRSWIEAGVATARDHASR